MKTILVLAIIAITSVFAIDIGCYPSAVQSSSNQLYVSYNKNAYKYSLPDLNLKASKSYNQYVCGPATISSNNVRFAASQPNSNSTLVSGNDLSIVSQSNSAAPYPPAFSNLCVTVSGGNYCFDYSNNVASIKKKNGNTVVESLTLPIADNGNYFITGDSAVAGRIHVATHSCQYRGCTQLQYYALAVNPLRIVRGPVALPHTVFSGCPVEPKSCAVDVLLSGTVSVQDDIVSYAWSISDNGDFKVSLVSYDARCNKFKNVRLGESLAVEARCSGTPTSAPATTQAPTRNCWTCAAGYVHWYDIQGFPEPADKCACVPRTVATTKAPAHNCWTCPAGYVHWYDIQGYPEPADKCACVRPATSAPVTTTKAPSATTKAPAHNCWTCPAGFVHWYDINGMPEPADKCACVRPATGAPVTTKAPARNCWTCPAGFVHWYDIQGYPEPADKCACVRPATSAPTRNCWTCPAGYVHWYDIPNAQEPADKCACVRRSRDLNTLVQSSN